MPGLPKKNGRVRELKSLSKNPMLSDEEDYYYYHLFN